MCLKEQTRGTLYSGAPLPPILSTGTFYNFMSYLAQYFGYNLGGSGLIYRTTEWGSMAPVILCTFRLTSGYGYRLRDSLAEIQGKRYTGEIQRERYR